MPHEFCALRADHEAAPNAGFPSARFLAGGQKVGGVLTQKMLARRVPVLR